MPDRLASATQPSAEAEQQSDSPARTVAGALTQDEWDRLNRRRSQLIAKEFSAGLTPDEEAELAGLQAELERKLDVIAPLSFDAVEELAEVLQRVEAHGDQPARPGTKSP